MGLRDAKFSHISNSYVAIIVFNHELQGKAVEIGLKLASTDKLPLLLLLLLATVIHQAIKFRCVHIRKYSLSLNDLLPEFIIFLLPTQTKNTIIQQKICHVTSALLIALQI